MIRTILDWAITSSTLILLVLALRWLVGRRVSPRLRYGLWLLVMVRLATPNLPWESGISVLAAAGENPGYQLAATLPERMELREDGTVGGMASRREEHFNWDGLDENGENSETFHNDYGWLLTPDVEEARALWEQGEKAVDTASLKRMVDAQSALGVIWQCGAWLLGGFFLIVNLRFYRDLRKKRQPTGEYRGLPVYEAEGLASPCLFGLFSPAIYLTPGLEGAERDHVLAHEYTHFRQGDHGWAIWRGVLLAVHWYNPLVWLAAGLSRRDCELACDEGAVKLLGEEHRADYGRTLVGLVTRKTAPADLLRCATTMTGGKSALKERVALLVKRPRTTALMAVLVAAACVLFSVCTFTGAAAGPEDAPPQEEQEPADAPEPAPPGNPPQPETLLEVPEDLPTALMNLNRPAEEQGEWLLLAQAPGFDIALYRSAGDDQHVYLRVTNQSFQRFDRDLSGMELLPTLEVVEGEADTTVQALYRRYQGIYFSGSSYEPAIVADQVLYTWHEEGKYWDEEYISTQPALLTQDMPALADLPDRIVGPGTPEAAADMWRIGEVSEAGLSLYYQQSTGKTWLRDENAATSLGAIQEVEGVDVCMPQMILPELYWADLDGDGLEELAAVSCEASGTGVRQEVLTVFRRSGQRWTWTTHVPETMANSFNQELVYQFYEDGTAYLSCWGEELLLDLSELWERGYWDRAPDYCGLTALMTSYTYEDGGFVLSIGGEILDSAGPHLHGYCFEYVCPITYISDYSSGEGYLSSRSGVLRSEFAAEQPEFDPDSLSQPLRRAMGEFIEDCRAAFPDAGMEALSQNRFALHDLDGDGREELICELNAAESGTNRRTTVYNANGTVRREFEPSPVFYDNGVVSEPWSHNQGQACAIWPYTLYQYTPALGYQACGGARAISSQMERFPRAADRDGDGMVYYIGEDAYREEHPVDGDAYQAWREQYLAGAKVVPVRYFHLTEELIAVLA